MKHEKRPIRPHRRERFGAGILLVRDRHVFLSQRSATEHEPFTWACFGGMSEPGETPEECAIRETREESGVVVPFGKLVRVYDWREGNGFHFTTYMAVLDDAVNVVHSSESHATGSFPLGDDVAALWSGLPTPLHSGMLELVANARVAATVVRELARAERSFDVSAGVTEARCP